ncbi:MAG: FixH family protein, partial [Gammaproteobacteria bacterium]
MNTQALPWYTYKIVWLVIAIPAASVFAGMFMIYLAVNTDDGLVVDDYYKEGMAINQSLLRDKTATKLGLSAQLRVEEAGDMVRLS